MAISKQDRSGVRTASDLERKYDLAAIVGIKQAVKNSVEGINKTNTTLEEFMKVTLGSLEELQNQIDGNITTWFYNGEPTLSNAPANEWTTDEDKENHIGDLYYDKDTGYSYRFTVNNGTYEWFKISDSDVTEALALANAASDTADSKRRVFTVTPIPPYDSGDLWFNNNEIFICQVSKPEGEIYAEKDFIIATKYTDDTYAMQVGDELEVVKGTVTTIKEGVDKFEVDITTTVNAQGKEIETAKTSIAANTEEINLRVKKDGVIGAINLSEEEALIQAARINLVGAVTISALDNGLKTTIDDTNANANNAINTANKALDLSQSTNTASGNPISLVDSAEGKVIEFKAYGTSDTPYTGKNKLNMTALLNSAETWIVDAYYLTLRLEPNTEYTCSSDVPYSTEQNGNAIYFNGTSFAANGAYVDRPMTITTPANGRVFIAIAKNRTYTEDLVNGKYYIQIEKGSATSYEPYVGNGLEIKSISDNAEYLVTIPSLEPFTKGNTICSIDGTYGLLKESDGLFEPFSEDVQEAIRNMPTYAGGTYFTAISGCNMEVEYYRDTVTGQQLANIYNTVKNADDAIAQWCYENDTTIIDGRKIATGTITADKLTVNDLVSLNATIGGWIIDDTGFRSVDGKYFLINSGKYEGNDYIRKNMAVMAGDYNDVLESYQLMLGFDGSVISSCRPDELYTGYFTQYIGKPVTWEDNYYVTIYSGGENKQYLHSQVTVNNGGTHFSFFENTGALYRTVNINGTHVIVNNEKIMEFSDDGIIVPKILSHQGQFLELYCAGKIRSSTGEFANCYADNIQTRAGANLDTLNNSAFKSQEPITDANTALANGAYRVGDATINTPGTNGILLVFAYGTGSVSGSAVFQIYVEYNGQYQTRMGWYGTWFSWSSTTYSLNDTQAIEQKGEIL